LYFLRLEKQIRQKNLSGQPFLGRVANMTKPMPRRPFRRRNSTQACRKAGALGRIHKWTWRLENRFVSAKIWSELTARLACYSWLFVVLKKVTSTAHAQVGQQF